MNIVALAVTIGLLFIMPITVSVSVSDENSVKIVYSKALLGFQATIIDVINEDDESFEANIPEKIGLASVTKIDDYVFADCTKMTSISLPSSIESIGEYAFSGCSSLESITIYDSVVYIGDNAFESCDNLVIYCERNSASSSWSSDWNVSLCKVIWRITEISSTDLFDYVISDGVIYLSAYNGSDTEVTIPSEINGYSVVDFSNIFSGNKMITSIVVPDSITTISNTAFYNCSNLKSITLPFIDDTAGDSSSNNYFGYIFGASKYSENSTYVPNNLKTVVITSESYIGNYAFYGCSKITSIAMNDEITYIGGSVFYDCSSLISIEIADNVTFLGSRAFYNCSSLVDISLPESLTSIGESSFYNCSRLIDISLPEGITSIGEQAFYSCSSLESIIIPDSVTTLGEYAFHNCTSLESVTIGDGIETINQYVFSGCSSLVEVVLGEKVETIGERAFYSCSALESIEFPDSLISIEQYAFWSCSSLKSLEIPDSVTSIGYNAFQSCEVLESITLGSNLTSIGNNAFLYCNNLKEVINNSELTITAGSTDNGCVAYYVDVADEDLQI